MLQLISHQVKCFVVIVVADFKNWKEGIQFNNVRMNETGLFLHSVYVCQNGRRPGALKFLLKKALARRPDAQNVWKVACNTPKEHYTCCTKKQALEYLKKQQLLSVIIAKKNMIFNTLPKYWSYYIIMSQTMSKRVEEKTHSQKFLVNKCHSKQFLQISMLQNSSLRRTKNFLHLSEKNMEKYVNKNETNSWHR